MPFVFGNAYFDEFCQHIQYNNIHLMRFLAVEKKRFLSFFYVTTLLGLTTKKD